MSHSRQVWQSMGFLICTAVVLTHCAYDTAIGRLSPQEQAELYVYRHVMTPAQARTYLAHTTATARTAYLHEIGLAQRYQALAPLDRDAIRGGFPRPGMSAEALRFVWGAPYYTAGRAHHYEHWYYLGSSAELGASGSQPRGFGHRVDVYLVNDLIVSWVDFPLSSVDASDCQCQ